MEATILLHNMLWEPDFPLSESGEPVSQNLLRDVAQSVNRYGNPCCYDALTISVSSVTFTHADWQIRSITHTPFYCDRLTFGRNRLQKRQDNRRALQHVITPKAEVSPHGLGGCSPNGVPSPQQAMTDPWGLHVGAELDRSMMRIWLCPIRLGQADGRICE